MVTLVLQPVLGEALAEAGVVEDHGRLTPGWGLARDSRAVVAAEVEALLAILGLVAETLEAQETLRYIIVLP